MTAGVERNLRIKDFAAADRLRRLPAVGHGVTTAPDIKRGTPGLLPYVQRITGVIDGDASDGHDLGNVFVSVRPYAAAGDVVDVRRAHRAAAVSDRADILRIGRLRDDLYIAGVTV